jgi:RNA polymerase primary sigma factor
MDVLFFALNPTPWKTKSTYLQTVKTKTMGMRQLKITNSITNRESPSLEKYLQEIDKLKMISPDEEVRLAALIRKGDKDALEKLTKANLRFVVSVAKQYQGQGLSLPDLINEGNLGLIKAAERFDDTRGFKFISFAVWWIRQNILHALGDNAKMIRVPLNKVIISNRIHKTASMLEQQLERAPSPEELADALNMDLDEVERGLRHKQNHVSLDSPLSDDEESTLIDTIENENAEATEGDMIYGESLRTELARTFHVLNDRQRQTLCYFFGIGMDHPWSLEDIGREFHLTTERVRQIKDKAIEKLRTKQNINLLRGFLG